MWSEEERKEFIMTGIETALKMCVEKEKKYTKFSIELGDKKYKAYPKFDLDVTLFQIGKFTEFDVIERKEWGYITALNDTVSIKVKISIDDEEIERLSNVSNVEISEKRISKMLQDWYDVTFNDVIKYIFTIVLIGVKLLGVLYYFGPFLVPLLCAIKGLKDCIKLIWKKF